MHITIYHNPSCGTSRNTLALIRNTGIEPQVEVVLDILSLPQKGAFTKEDGEAVITEKGERVSKIA